MLNWQYPVCEVNTEYHETGTFDDIQRLAQRNPIVYALLELHRRGKVSREQMLVSCVLLLADANEGLIQELVDERARHIPVTLIRDKR